MVSIPIPTNLPPRKLRSNISVQVDNLANDDYYNDGYNDGDDFMMYEFKVRPCIRARKHDWTVCPLVHPGEKARRRDPRKFHYSGTVCPDYNSARGSVCPRGDSCEFVHGVFELWLHPAKYRTIPCRNGEKCTRKVCFFAHSKRQLRVVQPGSMFLSPTSTLVGPTEGWGRRKGWLVEELTRRLEEMEIVIAPSAMGDDGGGEPDLEWVDELLE